LPPNGRPALVGVGVACIAGVRCDGEYYARGGGAEATEARRTDVPS